MDNDTKVYDTATLAFKKLNPNPGDVIIVTFPTDIEHYQMENFGAELQPHIPDDVAIVCTREGVTVETMSELQMNKLGWYKFDTEKVN